MRTVKDLYINGDVITISPRFNENELAIVAVENGIRAEVWVTTADLIAAVAAETHSDIVPSTPEAVAARNARELALYGIDLFDTHTCKAVPKDAVVILRNTLPEVTGEEPGYSGYVKIDGKTFGLFTVDFYDESIRNLIALREYVATHPPVDPKIAAVMSVIENHETLNRANPISTHDGATHTARRKALAEDVLAVIEAK